MMMILPRVRRRRPFLPLLLLLVGLLLQVQRRVRGQEEEQQQQEVVENNNNPAQTCDNNDNYTNVVVVPSSCRLNSTTTADEEKKKTSTEEDDSATTTSTTTNNSSAAFSNTEGGPGILAADSSSHNDDDNNNADDERADDNNEQRPEKGNDADDDRDNRDDDPNLRAMPYPEYDHFKAYVRADISSFYGEPAGSRIEVQPAYNGQACKFINMSPDTVSEYWEGHDGQNVYFGQVQPWEASGTACYPSHSFIYTNKDNEKDILVRFRVVAGISVYYYDPFIPDDPSNPAQGVTGRPARPVALLEDDNMNKYNAHVRNLEFGRRYKNFTGGSEWLSMYPRGPPRHYMWRADYFGQVHMVSTAETQFHTLPPDQFMIRQTAQQQQRRLDQEREDKNAAVPFSEYRGPDPVLNLTLKVLSVAPRVFEIEHFLSEREVDHLIDIVQRKNNLERSTTNGQLSTTRTSRTTWIQRHADPVTDAIYRRVADALKLDEALLRARRPGEIPDLPPLFKINEDMQIVHYDVGQEYTPHHDFGYPTDVHRASRSINLAMYLNDVGRGGYTSFPRWRNAETPNALRVKPAKGKAIFFYMINPDGNLDDLTQHAGTPVRAGEKYFSNLWIWDPIMR